MSGPSETVTLVVVPGKTAVHRLDAGNITTCGVPEHAGRIVPWVRRWKGAVEEVTCKNCQNRPLQKFLKEVRTLADNVAYPQDRLV